MRFSLVMCFFLAACASQPLSFERWESMDQIGAVSLLGDELVVDFQSRALLQPIERTLNVSSWRMDATFRDVLSAGVRERRKQFHDFDLDSTALEKAARVRESRWKKIVGKQSQAVLDLLFREADLKGIRYFFLLSSPANRERFSTHRGNYGVACDDRIDKDARAFVYFFFDFSFWDVAHRRKVFATTVDPKVTEAMSFGGCSVIAELKDPEKQLEDPMKKTMSLLVDALFDKMGWRRPGQP